MRGAEQRHAFLIHEAICHRSFSSALPQVSDFPEEQLLVAVFPGVPTAAELFLLPHKNQSEGKKKSEEGLEQVCVTSITFDHKKNC